MYEKKANKDLKVQITREGLIFGATSRGKSMNQKLNFGFQIVFFLAEKEILNTLRSHLLTEEAKVIFCWYFTYNTFTIQYCLFLLLKNSDKKRKTSCKIDWEKFMDEDDSDKKELDVNNSEDWKNLKPRPTP
ncbi:hypothetical protein RFI_37392 [Reticulomyxa filosa]|uniref:Uncharacterized protein n=1 Tax=Reticulomyxa filosa TaxID=46433 RepID=X6LFZ8_RETFI|nr:hypothetical protein RFI_37392 [Reticulomyxa filosa]|eukprot:ETO00067.1 hypothetical protein RFI_37392 [Reticulomyxa filosa]